MCCACHPSCTVLNNALRKPRNLYSTSTSLVKSRSSYEKYSWIYMYTTRIENKPSLSLVHQEFVEKQRARRPAKYSVLWNFSNNSTFHLLIKIIIAKRSLIWVRPCFQPMYIAYQVAWGQTDTQNNYRNPHACTEGEKNNADYMQHRYFHHCKLLRLHTFGSSIANCAYPRGSPPTALSLSPRLGPSPPPDKKTFVSRNLTMLSCEPSIATLLHFGGSPLDSEESPTVMSVCSMLTLFTHFMCLSL